MPKRILILGGTTEAFEVAERLTGRPNVKVVYSLAGRVAHPKLPPGEVRIGGFGGVDGLRSYLLAHGISAVIDATHPYAAKISHNAYQVCHSVNIPLIAYQRPPWQRQPQDNWHSVPNPQAAAVLIDRENNRVFLSIGRQELDAFSHCRHAYFLIRAIDQPEAQRPSNSQFILDRGPFALAGELEMLRTHCINWIVSKNSGGPATYPKIEAARELQIPIAMIDRPYKQAAVSLSHPDEIVRFLHAHLQICHPERSEPLLASEVEGPR
jgi:precorrin-6A/cobalt-precorrin-6A reductase